MPFFLQHVGDWQIWEQALFLQMEAREVLRASGFSVSPTTTMSMRKKKIKTLENFKKKPE